MRTAAACAVLCAAAFPAPPAAAPAPLDPPAVEVTVTDDVDHAEAGQQLDYRITVHNLGADEVPGARVEQELPATTVSATATDGTIEDEATGGRKAVWHTDLPAYGIAVFSAGAVLGARQSPDTSAAPGTRRAATTVCVYTARSAAPLACSGDLDDLPESRPEAEHGNGVGWAMGALACALFAPGVVRAVRRGRTRRSG
ncbi:DUF11 domain-containing protein [Streptomyces yunnanensis]|uniref:Conserved repeat domain-containing protein n=1 Tax=Streptomyces yunnanensis TaxID=156453 RepID=A0A9X8N143_9ACTN|nr:DUF11 domain-containing protein [Streptomyces yunnanensis]SHM60673.1 conserved repeat domain-containing protein [Streptomyces yunnanensis]